MIESIKIKIREDLVIELTLEEAKKLKEDLNNLTDGYQWKYYHVPSTPVIKPQPYWYEITCENLK